MWWLFLLLALVIWIDALHVSPPTEIARFAQELLPLARVDSLVIEAVVDRGRGGRRGNQHFRVFSSEGIGMLIKKGHTSCEAEAKGMAAYHKVMPHVVPKVLGCDSANNLLSTELITDEYRTLQTLLEFGHADGDISRIVGTTMGRSHARSHNSITTREQQVAYAQLFGNPDAIESTRRELFLPTIAMLEADSAPAVLGMTKSAVGEMHAAALLLLETFSSSKQALVHGDLLCDNILVRPDMDGSDEARCKLVDFEHFSLGAPGFDLGVYLSNLVFYFVAHSLPPARRALREGIVDTLNAYRSAFRVQLQRQGRRRGAVVTAHDSVEGIVDGIVRDALGFACLYPLFALCSAGPRAQAQLDCWSLEATPGYRWGDVAGREASVRRRQLRAVHAGLCTYLSGVSVTTPELFLDILAVDEALLSSEHQTEFW